MSEIENEVGSLQLYRRENRLTELLWERSLTESYAVDNESKQPT